MSQCSRSSRWRASLLSSALSLAGAACQSPAVAPALDPDAGRETANCDGLRRKPVRQPLRSRRRRRPRRHVQHGGRGRIGRRTLTKTSGSGSVRICDALTLRQPGGIFTSRSHDTFSRNGAARWTSPADISESCVPEPSDSCWSPAAARILRAPPRSPDTRSWRTPVCGPTAAARLTAVRERSTRAAARPTANRARRLRTAAQD